MKTQRILAILTLLALFVSSFAHAATREEKRVADATDVLDQLSRIPEKSIPPNLLSRAYAVAVIPNVVRAAFGLGLRRGKGVIVVRQDDNSWSNPAFITLTGGSIGWQAGADSTDVILVFKTRTGVDGIANGKLTLGANASVAAGPVGRHTSASTDIVFKAEVYSYSRSRGLFAGVALEGAGLTMDRKANATFYGSTSMTPEKIFVSSPNLAPDIANTFVQILTAQTTRLPTSPGMQAGAAQSDTGEAEADVRTFGMPEPGEADDETEYDPNY
jgi:lipid-binding SYLF domain-containing protein